MFGRHNPVHKFSPPGSWCIVFPSGASVNVWTFLIVEFESLNCPQWKDRSKNHSHCWKGFKDAVKLKNLQDMEDFSEEQSSVYLFRANKGLMNNHHKKNMDHRGNHTVLGTKGSQTFEGRNLNNSSYFFCLVAVNIILCEISYSGQY